MVTVGAPQVGLPSPDLEREGQSASKACVHQATQWPASSKQTPEAPGIFCRPQSGPDETLVVLLAEAVTMSKRLPFYSCIHLYLTSS